ncbi:MULTISPECIES: STAS domain-containing protein [unclassified Streptomyces]|uniref:STAS domain-containing protein n=1 Tax=unclassified Streptomyces TaxID=2593676 RepID=UPI0033A5D0AC
MTTSPPTQFTVTFHHEPPTLTARIAGELDYDTSDELLAAIAEHLPRATALRGVRVDFRDLTWIDSSGLAALLMIHRRTSTAGLTLHLDHRPAFLDRMLHLTNVMDHLTTPGAEARYGDQQDAAEAGAT